jgi:hypothetical protein
MTTSSDKCHEQSARYLGVLNGVWYGMDANLDSSGGIFKLAQQDIPSPAVARLMPGMARASVATPREPVSAVVGPPDEDRVEDWPFFETGAEDEDSETLEKPVKPFYRESAEPLRAGHPDLWNLLVAGTCLEGSIFQHG